MPAAAAGLTLYVMALSLAWRPVHDAPLMSYVGFLMQERGAVPYVDVFEMNAPGTLFLHQMLYAWVGHSERLQRLVDLSWLVATQLATFAFVRRWGAATGLLAAAAFSLDYLSWGAGQSFQRDYLCVLPVAASLCLAFRADRARLDVRAFGVGLFFGAAVTVKPPIALAFPLVVAGLLATRAVPAQGDTPHPWHVLLDDREALRAPVWALLGFVVVPALCVARLVSLGAWPAFVEVAREYWPLYTALREDATVRANPWEWSRFVGTLRGPGENSFAWVCVVALLLAVPRLLRRSVRDALEITVLFALFAAFLAYRFLAGKFWVYQSFPLFFVMSLLAGLAWWPVYAARSFRLASVQAALVGVLFLASWRHPDVPVPGIIRVQMRPSIETVAGLLRERMEPGDTVQPLDVTNGAVHAMLLARAPLASPFLYDFHFHHHPNEPIIRRLRRRMIETFERAPPRFIVLSRSWRPFGPQTAPFPELNRILVRDYELAWAAAPTDLVLLERRRPRAAEEAVQLKQGSGSRGP